MRFCSAGRATVLMAAAGVSTGPVGEGCIMAEAKWVAEPSRAMAVWRNSTIFIYRRIFNFVLLIHLYWPCRKTSILLHENSRRASVCACVSLCLCVCVCVYVCVCVCVWGGGGGGVLHALYASLVCSLPRLSVFCIDLWDRCLCFVLQWRNFGLVVAYPF